MEGLILLWRHRTTTGYRKFGFHGWLDLRIEKKHFNFTPLNTTTMAKGQDKKKETKKEPKKSMMEKRAEKRAKKENRS